MIHSAAQTVIWGLAVYYGYLAGFHIVEIARLPEGIAIEGSEASVLAHSMFLMTDIVIMFWLITRPLAGAVTLWIVALAQTAFFVLPAGGAFAMPPGMENLKAGTNADLAAAMMFNTAAAVAALFAVAMRRI